MVMEVISNGLELAPSGVRRPLFSPANCVLPAAPKISSKKSAKKMRWGVSCAFFKNAPPLYQGVLLAKRPEWGPQLATGNYRGVAERVGHGTEEEEG